MSNGSRKIIDIINKFSKRSLLLTGIVLFVFSSLVSCLSLFLIRQVYIQISIIIFVTSPLLLLIIQAANHLNFVKNHLMKIRTLNNRSNRRILYLESIIQDSSDIIFTVDTDGYILKFNRGSEMHFGYTQPEIVGKPLLNLFQKEADERKILSDVLLKGRSVNTEIPLTTKEGAAILVNLSISEMKNDNGEIIGLVVNAKDITEKKKLEIELQKKNALLSKLAITDSLTSLYNSRYFYDQIKRELKRYLRSKEKKLSLILLDIDRFKELNDSEGHQFGDKVLKTLGEIISVCIRQDIDSGYRYGGDEFVIILPDTNKKEAYIVAKRIEDQYCDHKFGDTSLSIGVTQAEQDDTVKTLIKRSDEAMYKSKKNGKGRITTV